jgi:hypothetical protein
MPSTVLPVINQAGKPAGVAGNSRDDLALFTGSGSEIQLSDTVGTASTFAWTLLDQPEGGTASLTTPGLASTLLTGATVAGSYLIQLVGDGGGSPGQIYRIIAAVQIGVPAWVEPTGILRIPAKGETIEFNVKDSPGTGPDTRGWAQEMDYWFRAIANYGFGFVAKLNGVQVGSAPFYYLNLSTALTATDAGGGVLDVGIAGGSSGITALQNATTPLSGGPFSTLDAEGPDLITTDTYVPGLNAQFSSISAPSGVGRLKVTAGAHLASGHTNYIQSPLNPASGATPLVPSINTGPNPNTVGITKLANALAVSNGRTITATETPSNFTISLSAPASNVRTLYDIFLRDVDCTVETQIVAQTSSANVPAVLIEVSPGVPTGSPLALAVDASGNWSWAGGDTVAQTSNTPEVLRLFDPTGLNYVDIYRYANPGGAASDNWTPQLQNPNNRLSIIRAPYWVNPGSGVATWGYALSGVQYFTDLRSFGSVSLEDASPDLIAKMDRVGTDSGWDVGVVFDHRKTTQASADQDYSSFALVVSGGNVTGCEAGVVWCKGRRYKVPTSLVFGTLGVASQYALIGLQIAPDESVSYVAITQSNPSVVAVIQTALANLGQNPYGQELTSPVTVPLYFGKFDSSSHLLQDERLDLRRNVAYIGNWTAGNRGRWQVGSHTSTNPQPAPAYTADLSSNQARAEFENVGAALAWHGAITGGNNLERFGGTVDNPACKIRVIRDTFETFPITLWNNVTIEGEGMPTVAITPRGNSTYQGLGFLFIGTLNSLSGLSSYNALAYNVRLKGFNLVATQITGPVTASQILTFNCPQWNPTSFASNNQPFASLLNVTVEDVQFGVINPSGYTIGSDFSAMAMFCESPSGSNQYGQFSNLQIRRCNTGLLYTNTGASFPQAPFDQAFALQPVGTGAVIGTGLVFDQNNFTVQGQAIYLGGGIAQLRFTKNVVYAYGEASVIEGGGLYFGTSCTYEDLWIDDNLIQIGGEPGTPILFDIEVLVRGAFIRDNRLEYVVGSLYDAGAITQALQLCGTMTDVEISGNSFYYFEIGIGVGSTASALNRIDIGNNNFAMPQRESGFMDGLSIGISMVGTLEDLSIHDNQITLFRMGIDIKCYATPLNHAIVNNRIRGQVDTSIEGSYHGRGIRWATVFEGGPPATNIGLVISNNTILDVVADAGGVDTSGDPGGGIIVDVGSSNHLYGMVIEGNTVQINTGVSDSFYFTAWLVGIYCSGSFPEGRIANNTLIQNDTLISNVGTSGANGTCGISLVTTAVQNSSIDTQIFGNKISWIASGNVPNGSSPTWDSQAGIHVLGNHNGINIQQNDIHVQALVQSGSYGYIHGIQLGNLASTGNGPANAVVRGNIVSAGNVNPGTPGGGTIGCAIWAVGNTNAKIDNNQIFGTYYYHNTLSSPSYWGLITAAADGASIYSELSVSNNRLEGFGSSSPISSTHLGSGIKVGNLILGSSVNYVAVNNNWIYIQLDSTNSGIESGGIVLDACGSSGSTAEGTNLQCNGNFVNRADLAGSPVSRGIRARGWYDSDFAHNKVVPQPTFSYDIEDVHATGATASNRWSGNTFGNATTVGTSSLGASYLVDPGSGTNWSGSAFV